MWCNFVGNHGKNCGGVIVVYVELWTIILFLCFVTTFCYQTHCKLPTQQLFAIHNLSNLYKQHSTFTSSQTLYITLANGKRFDYNGRNPSKHQCWGNKCALPS